MIDIRRVFTHVEHIHHEFGPRAATPLVRGAIGAVLTNPFAGRYEPDILPMMALLDPVGVDMAHRLRAASTPQAKISARAWGARCCAMVAVSSSSVSCRSCGARPLCLWRAR